MLRLLLSKITDSCVDFIGARFVPCRTIGLSHGDLVRSSRGISCAISFPNRIGVGCSHRLELRPILGAGLLEVGPISRTVILALRGEIALSVLEPPASDSFHCRHLRVLP